MVGHHRARLNDTRQHVGGGGANAEAREVGALRAAGPTHAVTLRAERRREHLLAIGEIQGALGLAVFPGLQGLGVSPEPARTLGDGNRRGFDHGRAGLEGGAFRCGYHRHGLLADIANEPLERIAALGEAQLVEEAEELFTEVRRPTDGGTAQVDGESDTRR